MVRPPLLLSVTVVMLAACGGGTQRNPVTPCTPGESRACTGVGGCSGGQVCAADGSRYEACDCGQANLDAGVTADAGTGGGATFCGFVETQIRICDGRRRTDWDFYCVDDTTSCGPHLRADRSTRHEDPLCYQRTVNTVYRDGPLPGTCAEYLAWQAGQIECFRDDQCYAPTGTPTCEQNICVCPEGVNCDCGPRAPQCDGDVLVSWNTDEACNYIEDRFDCAQIGARCDPQTRDCVPNQTRMDAGVIDSGQAEGDGGSGPGPEPDAGSGGPGPMRDAG